MTLESGKEMDRKCVFDWLNEVYYSPSLSYNQHTDDEIRIFAHDALVLLKEQEEPMAPVYDQLLTQEIPRCGKCGYRLVKGNDKYCCKCGKEVKWDD